MANRWTVVTGLLLLPLLWVPVRGQAGSVTVVETAPVETVMDDPNVPEAWTVWREMLRGARSHVEIAGFYFSNRDSSRLEAVLQEVLAAGARGVQVRVLGDRGFYDTYPETLNRLATSPGIEARLIDFRALAGGPMHAKYFIVDGHEAFVGSQNWDWRALEHIHELGLRVTLPAYVAMLHAVFAYDWERATGLGSEPLGEIPALATEEPSVWEWMGPDSLVSRMRPAMSPKGYLPDETQWDLPQILGLIDGAQDSLQVTLLSYAVHSRGGGLWHDLDHALRAAGERGVTVRLMVADWSKSEPRISDLKSLQQAKNVEVRLVTVPQASMGFIPYARVIHAKYMTVDGARCWLGTSNWEESYFTKGRGVGLVAESVYLTRELEADFSRWWNGPYAETVDPAVEYVAPRVGD